MRVRGRGRRRPGGASDPAIAGGCCPRAADARGWLKSSNRGEIAMSEKPSYLGLLNAIALAEGQAHKYLSAWIAKTSDPDVCAVLSTVAAREGEHGMSFAKRINELGYAVRAKDDPGYEKRLAIALSDRSDLEKMEKLGLGRLDTGDRPDIFDDVFKDHTIDIATGALLGRYIAEERDSARILRCCYEQLQGRTATGSPETLDRLETLEAKVDALCGAVEELRHELGTTAKTAKTNGSGDRK